MSSLRWVAGLLLLVLGGCEQSAVHPPAIGNCPSARLSAVVDSVLRHAMEEKHGHGQLRDFQTRYKFSDDSTEGLIRFVQRFEVPDGISCFPCKSHGFEALCWTYYLEGEGLPTLMRSARPVIEVQDPKMGARHCIELNDIELFRLHHPWHILLRTVPENGFEVLEIEDHSISMMQESRLSGLDEAIQIYESR